MNLDFKFEITLNLCTFLDKAQWIVDTFSDTLDSNAIDYRTGTVNSKSFVGKVLLRIKWKFPVIQILAKTLN